MPSRIKFFPSVFLALSLVPSGFVLAQESSSGAIDNFASKPTVVVGGFINTTSAFRSTDDAFNGSRLPDAQAVNGTVNNSTGSRNYYNNDVDFANDSEVHIKVGGINEFGMKYGAVIELEADVSSDGRNEGINADKSYVFTESRSGRFEFGNNVGANQKMKVGPASFARAAGGINGKYLEYINLPMLADSSQNGITKIGNCDGFQINSAGTITTAGADCSNIKLPKFILIPQSPIAHGGYAKGFYNKATDNAYNGTVAADNLGFNKGSKGSFGDAEDATKVSYFTPRVSGWQLGLSFTPDTGNSGSSAAISGNDSGDVSNVISWGANYSNNIGNLGFALSLTGETGKYEQISNSTVNTVVQRNDLNAYDIGAMATYFGFTVGASYGVWGDSLMPSTGAYSCQYSSNVALANQNCQTSNYTGGVTKFGDAHYFTGGVAYQFGPVAFSATHLSSNFQENKYSATSIGADYRMAKGFMPYLEVTKFAFESNQAKGSDAATATSNVNQSAVSEDQRQIKDNKGYVALAGVIFSF